MTQGNRNNPRVALVATSLCIAFVVFVFVYDDLKTDPFVQGVTGLLVTLAIAVVLFSAVPGSKTVIKVGVGLAGAAAFYFAVLPRVKPFIFSFYSFTGYVAYESATPSEKEFIPVDGAEVEIKGTGLKGTTNVAGAFTISNVPTQITVRELMINRAGHFYVLETKKFPNKIFRIPKEPSIIKSVNYPIEPNEWVEGSANACLVEKDKFSNIAQFLLTKSVPNDDGYSDLIVRVWSPDNAIEIINARKSNPSAGSKVQDEAGYSRAQKWQLPLNGRLTPLSFSICLGAAKTSTLLSVPKPQAAYWFEKVE